MATSSTAPRKPSGPAVAAMVAAGLGTFTIGLMTSLAEASAGLRNALTWYNPVGPLSGKTGVGVIVWLVAWIVLHTTWKNREISLGRGARWALVLILLGFLLTFPPVFDLFARE